MTKPNISGLHRDLQIEQTVFDRACELFELEKYTEAYCVLEDRLNNQHPVEFGRTVSAAECWCLAALCCSWNGDIDGFNTIQLWLDRNFEICSLGRFGLLLHCEALMHLSRYDEVLDIAQSAIEDQLSSGQFDVGELLLYRGYVRMRLGDLDGSLVDFEASYSFARLKHSLRLESETANYLGVAYFGNGNLSAALHWYMRALSAGKELGSKARQGRSYLNIGICEYKSSEYRAAVDSLSNALDLLGATNDHSNLTRTQIALGNVHRLTRNFAPARQHLTQAYTMATELKIPREECLALEFLGDVFRDEGKPEEARRYYQRGMAIAQDIAPDGDLVMELLRREGECLTHEGKLGAGLEILAKARLHAKKLGDRFEEGVILRCLAQGMLAAGDLDPALNYAEQAATQLENISARHEHAIARLTMAEILLQQSEEPNVAEPRDKLDLAWEQALIAQGICRQLDIDYWTGAVRNVQSRIARRRAEEVRYAGAKQRPRQATGDRYEPGDVIIAESRAMQEVLQAIEAFSPYDEPILLTGETGTGKEVVARRVHQMSLRSDKPFVAVNVTAVPHTMFEREFFGHVKGSFSGADSDRTGLIAAADGGTLFLDEIGDLPPTVQAKFLRVLQDGSYLCVGDPAERRADLRVIAATNANLEVDVREGRFREDLYYRLAILEIPLSPLRDRPEDIRPLLDHFLSLSAGRQVGADRYFNEVSLRLLANYGWPGNVREIALVARRAHISLQTTGRVEIEVGSGEDAMVLRGRGQVAARAAAGSAVVATAVEADALSRARILLALEETGGNRAAAARLLGVARATLYRRLTKLGLN